MFLGTDVFQNRTGQGLTATHAYENGRFLVWYHGRARMAWSVADTGIHRSNYILEYALSAQEGLWVRAAGQSTEAMMGRREMYAGLEVRRRVLGSRHGGGRKPRPLPRVDRGCHRSSVGEEGQKRTMRAPGRRGGGEP